MKRSFAANSGEMIRASLVFNPNRLFSPPGKPCEQNTHLIEDDKREGDQRLVHRVKGGGNDSTEDESAQNSESPVSGKRLRADDIHLGEKEDENRSLKTETNGKKEPRHERDKILHPYLGGGNFTAEGNQECCRRWYEDKIAKKSSCGKGEGNTG